MSQLNIHDLYESARRKELKKFETFDKILQRCHNKIKLYAENHKIECIYEVPEFIIGVPLYNIEDLKRYLIELLRKDGFQLIYIDPNWLFITWELKGKKQPSQSRVKKNKKKKEEYKLIDEYKPSGNFATYNEYDLTSMKQKMNDLL